MNFRTKNNRFLKNLITTQFNITRYARTNTFYNLDLPALQRELKLLIRLLHHAKKKAAQMFLKPGNNSGSEEILTELVANLNLQIKILSKKNTTNPQTDKSLTKIKKPFLKRRREPAKIVFLFEKSGFETSKEIQKAYPHNTVVSFTRYINKLNSTYNVNNDFTDVKKLIFILVLIDKMLKI